jgi:hypothetical protein
MEDALLVCLEGLHAWGGLEVLGIVEITNILALLAKIVVFVDRESVLGVLFELMEMEITFESGLLCAILFELLLGSGSVWLLGLDRSGRAAARGSWAVRLFVIRAFSRRSASLRRILGRSLGVSLLAGRSAALSDLSSVLLGGLLGVVALDLHGLALIGSHLSSLLLIAARCRFLFFDDLFDCRLLSSH